MFQHHTAHNKHMSTQPTVLQLPTNSAPPTLSASQYLELKLEEIRSAAAVKVAEAEARVAEAAAEARVAEAKAAEAKENHLKEKEITKRTLILIQYYQSKSGTNKKHRLNQEQELMGFDHVGNTVSLFYY